MVEDKYTIQGLDEYIRQSEPQSANSALNLPSKCKNCTLEEFQTLSEELENRPMSVSQSISSTVETKSQFDKYLSFITIGCKIQNDESLQQKLMEWADEYENQKGEQL